MTEVTGWWIILTYPFLTGLNWLIKSSIIGCVTHALTHLATSIHAISHNDHHFVI